MAFGRPSADQFPSWDRVFPRRRGTSDVTEQTYDRGVTAMTRRLVVLTGLTATDINHIAGELTEPARQGRPWVTPLPARIVLCCAALRTNLTVRQLAAVFGISKSQAHRVIADLTPRLAGLLDGTVDDDRRWSWTVDGTLIPTRDKTVSGKSKNYQYSTNAQILSRRAGVTPSPWTPGGWGQAASGRTVSS